MASPHSAAGPRAHSHTSTRRTSRASRWWTTRPVPPAVEVRCRADGDPDGAAERTDGAGVRPAAAFVVAFPVSAAVAVNAAAGGVGGTGRRYVCICTNLFAPRDTSISLYFGCRTVVRASRPSRSLPTGPCSRRSSSIVLPSSGWRLTSRKICTYPLAFRCPHCLILTSETYGRVYPYDKTYDRITTRTEKPLQILDRIKYNTTTSDDPVIQTVSLALHIAEGDDNSPIFILVGSKEHCNDLHH